MTHSTPCMLAQVDSAIEQINRIKSGLDEAFIGLENATQEQIDEIIEEKINPFINKNLYIYIILKKIIKINKRSQKLVAIKKIF